MVVGRRLVDRLPELLEQAVKRPVRWIDLARGLGVAGLGVLG
jgi:hypothetical protein